MKIELGNSLYNNIILSREYLNQENIKEDNLHIFIQVVDTEEEKEKLINKYDKIDEENNYTGDSSSKWIVDIKGNRKGSFEISIIRENNNFCKGKDGSWGWFGKTKLLVNHNTDENLEVSKRIWLKIIKIAKDECKSLNKR